MQKLSSHVEKMLENHFKASYPVHNWWWNVTVENYTILNSFSLWLKSVEKIWENSFTDNTGDTLFCLHMK